MQVVQLEGYGVPMWSPSPLTKNYLATGTWTNDQKEQQSLLRISRYDINQGMNLMGQTLSPAKFSSLDWTDYKDEYGIIAGGMGDGAITLWDTRKIIEGYNAGDQQLKLGRGCVSAAPIHNGVPVNSIQFNPHKKNLLASGGSEVLIQDISQNIKQPNVFKPGVPNHHEGSRITSISWNRVVSHILASASENGKIVVWDLKINKSIFTFKEPSSNSGMAGAGGADDYFDYFGGSGSNQQQQQTQQLPQSRETRLVWNPEIPTQFLVANDDEQNPSFNIWDLRNPDYPVATFSDIHYNGILSVSWSLADPNLLVSSAKDYRSVVVNAKTGEQILEFPSQQAFNRIEWSTNLKGKICGMDEEGNTSILSYQPEGLFSNPASQFSNPIATQSTSAYAPRWLQPKSGARFGFGNNLVSFGGANGSLIKVHHQPVKPTLAQRIINFDQELETMELSQVLDRKIQESPNDIDKMEFVVMKCIFKNEFDELLKMFNFDKLKIVGEVEKYLGKKLAKSNQELLPVANHTIPNPVKDLPLMTAEGAADFFSELGKGSQKETEHSSQLSNNHKEEQKAEATNNDYDNLERVDSKLSIVTETVSRNTNWDEGAEGIIKHNLLVGNLEYAAEVALKCGRTAEALLIAEAGGQTLYDRIKEEYFMNQKDSYVKLFLRSIVQDDFKELVSSQAFNHKSANWKESLAYLISYVESEEMKVLSKDLGDELLNKRKDINSAIICYLMSQSMEVVIDLWKKRALFMMKKGIDRNQALFLLFEKCILYKTVCKNLKIIVDLDLIITDIAEYMASEELTTLALKYLELSNPKQPNVAIIKERIYNSDSARLVNKSFVKPQLPYQVEKIRVQMPIQQYQQQQQKGRGQPHIQQQNIRQPLQQHQQQMPQHQRHLAQGTGMDQTPQRQMPPSAGPRPMMQPSVMTKPNVPQQDIGLVHNFGYKQEQSQLPLIRPPGPGSNFGSNQLNQVPPRPDLSQITQQQLGARGPLPANGPAFGQQAGFEPIAKPKIFNPNETTQKQKEEELMRQNAPVPPKMQQTQPKPNIRPPPIGTIRPPGMGGPAGMTGQNVPPSQMMDQSRPMSSNLSTPSSKQRMPPPPMASSQMTQQTIDQSPMMPPPSSSSSYNKPLGGPPPMNQGPRPRFPPGIGANPRPNMPPTVGQQRPPMMGPGGMPQAQPNIPPPGRSPQLNQSQGFPPTGGPVGSRPSSQRGPQTLANNITNGGGQAPAPEAVMQSLTNLFDIYAQYETNQKMKQQTQILYSNLQDRLSKNEVSPHVLTLLSGITQAIESNNFAAGQAQHRELTQKYWNESKDWANSIKIMATFKQRNAINQ